VYLRLKNNCLKAAGQPGSSSFEDDPSVFLAAAATSDVTFSALWGAFDPDGARVHGYLRSGGLSESDVGIDPALAQECGEKAAAALPGGRGWFGLASTSAWPAGGPLSPVGDSRVTAAVTAWSDCMKGRGFTTTSPVTFALSFNELRGASSLVSSQEIAAATTDLACKVSTNLVGIGVAVQSAYDQAYLAEHQNDLIAWRATIDQFLRDNA